MWSASLQLGMYGPLYIVTFIEFVALSYLVYAMCLRRSPIRQAYFAISILAFFFDFTTKFSASLSINSKFRYVVLWHNNNLMGIVGLVLALNRFTAIAYWKNHYRMWSVLPTFAWCVFLLLYPVIVDIGFLASDPNGFTCLPNPYKNLECGKVYGRIGVRQCVLNVITTIGSITLSTMTIFKIRQTSAPQIARKLFIQSCVSNALFAVFTISKVFLGVMWIQGDTTHRTISDTATVVANFANYARQCINIVWLVIITRSMIRPSKTVVVSMTVTGTTIK